MADYTYTINNTGTPTVADWTWRDTSTWPSNTFYTYSLPVTVYMYQVFCPKPRCKGVMWGELDHTVVCPKCQSRIKLTREPKPDYEVEVS